MTVILLCVLVVPLWLAIGTIVSNADQIAGWVRSLSSFEVPPLRPGFAVFRFSATTWWLRGKSSR